MSMATTGLASTEIRRKNCNSWGHKQTQQNGEILGDKKPKPKTVKSGYTLSAVASWVDVLKYE